MIENLLNSFADSSLIRCLIVDDLMSDCLMFFC